MPVKDRVMTHNDRQRKRTFLIFASALALITLLMFTFFDARRGEINEACINCFMALIIILGNISIFKFNLDRIAYGIGINLMNLALLYDVSVGAGDGGGLFWIPVMPLFTFFFLERIEAICSAILFFGGVIVLLTYPPLFNTYPYDIGIGIRYLIALFFINIIAYGLESSRYRYARLLEQSNEELNLHKQGLESALSKVKTLSGLLPICSNCKKVRDDTGYWNQIETYIKEHSEADFSHGLCPECSDRFYGDQKWYKRMKQKKGPDDGPT